MLPVLLLILNQHFLLQEHVLQPGECGGGQLSPRLPGPGGGHSHEAGVGPLLPLSSPPGLRGHWPQSLLRGGGGGPRHHQTGHNHRHGRHHLREGRQQL